MDDAKREGKDICPFPLFFEIKRGGKEMGEIERRIWKEMEENKELREILNENMKKTAERLAKISFFSETFRKFHEKIAKGEIEIF